MQSNFRKGHSTRTFLLKVRDDIQKDLNKNKIRISALIDYSKALDTVQHEKHIKKVANFNFSNISLKMSLSYLSNRQ